MLRAALRLSVTAALAGLAVTSTFAQSVISAKSGLIHYIEGDVNVDGTPVSDRLGNFSEIKKGGQMSTELGRAEVLLTPGIFLRASENTTVKMMENRLSDTRVELLSGEAMVESETPMKDNQVTILYKDYAVTVNKHGLYGFETNPAQLKVYSGEAQVSFNGGPLVTVHDGRLMPFSPALATERFDNKEGDSLYRWSKRRSEYLSIANVSAAKAAQNSGYGSSLVSPYGNWFYNSFYNMFTYLPYRGTLYSPFGFAYFSPFTVNSFYAPGYYYTGYGSGGGGSFYSRGSSVAAATSAAASRLSGALPASGSLGSSIGRGSAAPSGGHR